MMRIGRYSALTGVLLAQILFLLGCIEKQPLPQAPEFEFTFGAAKNELAGGLVELPNQVGMLMVGGSQNEETGDYDLLLVKTKWNGEEEWSRKIGVPERDEIGWKVIRNSIGDYVILGTSSPKGGGNSLIQLTALDGSFALRWQTSSSTTIPNTGLSLHGASFYELLDGGYLAGFAAQGYPATVTFGENGAVSESVAFSDFATLPKGHLLTKGKDDGYDLVSVGVGWASSNVRVGSIDRYGTLTASADYTNLGSNPHVLAAERLQDGRLALSAISDLGHQLVILDTAFQLLAVTQRDYEPYFGRILETQSHRLLLLGDEQFYNSYGYPYTGGNSNFQIVLFDSLGTQIRQSSVGGTYVEHFREGIVLSDGRVALLGETTSYGNGGTDLYWLFYNE